MFDLRAVLGDESLETLKRKREELQSSQPVKTRKLRDWQRHAGLLREEGGVREWSKQFQRRSPDEVHERAF